MLEAMIAGMQEEAIAKRENEIRSLAPGRDAKNAKRTLAPAKKAGVRAKVKKATPKVTKRAGPKK